MSAVIPKPAETVKSLWNIFEISLKFSLSLIISDPNIGSLSALLLPHSINMAYDGLGEGHSRALSRLVGNFGATELALSTYAQIIDGLPTCHVAWEQIEPQLERRHPINLHFDICPEAMDKAREIRAGFDINILRFDPKVC
jgi:hypothetical protein